MQFLIFAPSPPFKGKAHLVRNTAPGRTVCGRDTVEEPARRAALLLPHDAPRFGWSLRPYTDIRQSRNLCRRCQG